MHHTSARFLGGITLAIALAAPASSQSSSPPPGGLASSTCPNTEFYCTAKVNSQGCLPELTFEGCPSASAGLGFVLTLRGVISNPTFSILTYGLNGAASIPLGGGTLCVAPPISRTPVSEWPTVPNTCNNILTFDFNVWIASGSDPSLVAGQKIWLQYWYRDPNSTEDNAIGLSRGLASSLGV